MKKLNGLATGIGSLPHTDTDAALDLIFKYTPHIPFWPQLPKRDIRERMVIQSSEGLPCFRLNDKDLVFDSSNQEQELTRFYERIITDDSEYFKMSGDFADGLWQFLKRLEKQDINKIEFIKGQITGPFTFAASINDAEGRAILHNPVIFQAIREGLAMKARWQMSLLKKFGKPVIIFFDEPYLACLGSGFTAINRKDVVEGLTEFTEKIKSADGLTPPFHPALFKKGGVQQNSIDVGQERAGLIGVHCCGNTDWSIFTDISYIDIISFDAFNFLDRILLYTENLRGFFKRGGILAWGIVPTEAFSKEINAGILAKKLSHAFNLLLNKGIQEETLKNRLILTPACGLGTLSCDKAEPIFKCLDELFSIVRSENI
jgi:hypothetical protein